VQAVVTTSPPRRQYAKVVAAARAAEGFASKSATQRESITRSASTRWRRSRCSWSARRTETHSVSVRRLGSEARRYRPRVARAALVEEATSTGRQADARAISSRLSLSRCWRPRGPVVGARQFGTSPSRRTTPQEHQARRARAGGLSLRCLRIRRARGDVSASRCKSGHMFAQKPKR
jgi:hypothetical protein